MIFLAFLTLLPDVFAQVQALSSQQNQYQLNGPTAVCNGGDSVLYVMDSYPGTLSYQWQLPQGMTGESESDSIWVLVSELAKSGPLTVRAILPDYTKEWSLNVDVYDRQPAKVDTIIGPTTLSSIDSYAHYYASSIPPALNYEWIFPNGFYGESYGANATLYLTDSAASAKIGVVPINPCGRGDTTYLNVAIITIRNDTIRGDTVVCRNTNQFYWSMIENDTATFFWKVPKGFNIYGGSSNAGITVLISDSAVSGTIRAYYWSGNDSVLVGKTYVRILTDRLKPATEIHGPNRVYRGDEQVNFWVDPIPDAKSYQWVLPSGMYGSSSTNRIQLDIGSWAESDNISVRGVNSCYTGLWKSMYISVKDPSFNSDSIFGPEWLCAGKDSFLYEVPEMDYMQDYRWTLSPNLTGSSTTNKIWVSVADTATYATLTVVGYNPIETSNEVVRHIKVSPLYQQLVITGANAVNRSNVPIYYSVNKQVGLFTYFWELPTGFNGTSGSDSIAVTVSNSATSGWVRVTSSGRCGQGATDSLFVTVDTLLAGINVVKTNAYTYPNPVRETLNVRSPLLLDGQAVVTVFDLFGVKLPIEAVGKGEERTLNFSQQPAGFYLIVVRTPTKMDRLKILKQ